MTDSWASVVGGSGRVPVATPAAILVPWVVGLLPNQGVKYNIQWRRSISAPMSLSEQSCIRCGFVASVSYCSDRLLGVGDLENTVADLFTQNQLRVASHAEQHLVEQ